jgi:hypothetical protein
MTAASVTSPANNRLMPVLSGSNHNPLDLIEAELVATSIVELRRARRRMVRHPAVFSSVPPFLR